MTTTTTTKTYIGIRLADGTCRVYVDEPDRRRLYHRTGAGSHSPAGFEWGYCGSGPAELARALVKDVTGDPDPSPRVYQRFKFLIVALLPHDQWTLTEDVIRNVLDHIDKQIAVLLEVLGGDRAPEPLPVVMQPHGPEDE